MGTTGSAVLEMLEVFEINIRFPTEEIKYTSRHEVLEAGGTVQSVLLF